MKVCWRGAKIQNGCIEVGWTHLTNRNGISLLKLYSIIKHVSVSKPISKWTQRQCFQIHGKHSCRVQKKYLIWGGGWQQNFQKPPLLQTWWGEGGHPWGILDIPSDALHLSGGSSTAPPPIPQTNRMLIVEHPLLIFVLEVSAHTCIKNKLHTPCAIYVSNVTSKVLGCLHAAYGQYFVGDLWLAIFITNAHRCDNAIVHW